MNDGWKLEQNYVNSAHQSKLYRYLQKKRAKINPYEFAKTTYSKPKMSFQRLPTT